MKPSIALIGPGKVGCAISQQLFIAGYPITTVISRNLQRAAEACQFIGCSRDRAATDLTCAGQAQVILLAVPDDQIETTAAALRPITHDLKEKTLIHFSGLHQASCLRAESASGKTLSIHPLLPFADRQLASQRLSGCPCALEGDETSMTLGRELIEAFGGWPFLISSDKKALYHAAACIASNYLVTLLAQAETLLSICGVAVEDCLPLLLPLVEATLGNVTALGTQKGLTGPIVRGDIATLHCHINALSQYFPEQLTNYTLLAQQTVTLASKSQRLDQESAEKILTLLFSLRQDTSLVGI